MNYNIINEYINFSKHCINNYFKKIFDKEYNQGIVNTFLNSYIDARYYTKSSNLALTIRKNLNEVLKNFNSNELQKAINIVQTFNFILYFDNVVDCESTVEVVEAIKNFRNNVLKIATNKNFNDELLEMVKEDLIKKKEYLDNINDKKFAFQYVLTSLNNVYDITVNQNLKFPDVYNSVVINRVFKSKDMNTKRASVEYTYTTLKVLQDMIRGFSYEYLVSYPSGISNNKNSLNKLLTILDNDFLKERVSIKVDFNDFLEEKEAIYSYMKEGYKFVAILNNDFEESTNNLELLKIFKYIMIKRRNRFDIINNFDNIIRVD